MRHRQVSAGWTGLAEHIQHDPVPPGSSGGGIGGGIGLRFGDTGGFGGSGFDSGGDGLPNFGFGGGEGGAGSMGMQGWDLEPSDADWLTLGGNGVGGGAGGGGGRYRPGIMKHARSAGSIAASALGWSKDGDAALRATRKAGAGDGSGGKAGGAAGGGTGGLYKQQPPGRGGR